MRPASTQVHQACLLLSIVLTMNGTCEDAEPEDDAHLKIVSLADSFKKIGNLAKRMAESRNADEFALNYTLLLQVDSAPAAYNSILRSVIYSLRQEADSSMRAIAGGTVAELYEKAYAFRRERKCWAAARDLAIAYSGVAVSNSDHGPNLDDFKQELVDRYLIDAINRFRMLKQNSSDSTVK